MRSSKVRMSKIILFIYLLEAYEVNKRCRHIPGVWLRKLVAPSQCEIAFLRSIEKDASILQPAVAPEMIEVRSIPRADPAGACSGGALHARGCNLRVQFRLFTTLWRRLNSFRASPEPARRVRRRPDAVYCRCQPQAVPRLLQRKVSSNASIVCDQCARIRRPFYQFHCIRIFAVWSSFAVRLLLCWGAVTWNVQFRRSCELATTSRHRPPVDAWKYLTLVFAKYYTQLLCLVSRKSGPYKTQGLVAWVTFLPKNFNRWSWLQRL